MHHLLSIVFPLKVIKVERNTCFIGKPIREESKWANVRIDSSDCKTTTMKMPQQVFQKGSSSICKLLLRESAIFNLIQYVCLKA